MSEITKIEVYDCDGLVVAPWPEPGTYALVPLVEGEVNYVELAHAATGVIRWSATFDLRAKEDERQGERRKGWPYLVSDYDRRKYQVRNRRKEDLGREARDDEA